MSKYDTRKPNLLPDEPWFLVRGRDALSVAAITAYADAAKEASDKEQDKVKSEDLLRHALECQKIAHRFLDWQENNKDQTRMPKSERGRVTPV